ncbi:MAG: HAD-IIB family hydrolase [Bacteroidota bacterium]|nr:HAD-IIB family hydrolase [Bacteroidota bacterium]
MKKIVFTDLDGTLLDLKSYSYARSREAVEFLQNREIPLVFCSSKARAEQLAYQEALGVHHPFIVENGSAIYIPKGYFKQPIPFNTYHINQFEVIVVGEPVETIREAIANLRENLRLSFLCYCDLPAEEVSMYLGMDLNSARRAMQREFSESILQGSLSQRFFTELDKVGFRSIPGSRFQTIVSKQAHKGRAIELLLKLYEQEWGEVWSYGVGDHVNDYEMFKAVNEPALVQRPNGEWAMLEEPCARLINAIGPEGFSQAVYAMVGPQHKQAV